MSTTYTGVGGNVSQSTSPTITVPSDGDSLAVTSVNVGLDKLMDYIALIFGGAFTGQTSSTPGVAGTGGASAQGLKATAGGGSSPVKGMINLVPTTNAPSSADNGDLWMTTGGVIGAKANSVIRSLAGFDVAQTWTATQTYGAGLLASTQVVRAWATVTLGASGAVTINGSTNFTSAAWATNALTFTFTSNAPSINYAVIYPAYSNAPAFLNVTAKSVSQFTISRFDAAGGAVNWAQFHGCDVLVVW